eukprot:1160258-Pelagomonas_calceolata.AAC.8
MMISHLLASSLLPVQTLDVPAVRHATGGKEPINSGPPCPDMYICDVCHQTYRSRCMKELKCYTDEHRCHIGSNVYWACPACAYLNDDDKFSRCSGSFSKELVAITWEPSWAPEDTKETWPTFLPRILKFGTYKNEPDLSAPAVDFELDNLERQGFYKTDSKTTRRNKNQTWTYNKIAFDVNPTNPQADIKGIWSCGFWITKLETSPITQQTPI